jgi:Fe-S oxidoreductase
MAGAFGYDARYLDLSLQMAEESLLPAVRQADDDTVVVADGTSCRHQIEDGSGRQALHVARILEEALPASTIYDTEPAAPARHRRKRRRHERP